MAKFITLSLLAALLTACSGLPISGQGGATESDAARMNRAWLEWARQNNGGPN